MLYVLLVVGLAVFAQRLLRSARTRGEAGHARRSAALYVVHALLLSIIAVSPWYTGRVQADATVALVEQLGAQSPAVAKSATLDVAELRENGHDEVAAWVEAYAEGDRDFMKSSLDDMYQDISTPERAAIWAFSGDRIQSGYRDVVDSTDYRLLPLLVASVTAGRHCDDDEDWSRLIDNMSGPDSYVDAAISTAALEEIERDCQGVMASIDRDRLRDAVNDKSARPTLKSLLVNALLLRYTPGEMSR